MLHALTSVLPEIIGESSAPTGLMEKRNSMRIDLHGSKNTVNACLLRAVLEADSHILESGTCILMEIARDN